MGYDKPLPKPNADTRPFWDGCKEHQLRFQRCCFCSHVRWPPSVLCPVCHSLETKWITASGNGKIYSYVVYHVAPNAAFQGDLPYVTAVVELADGPRILTNIIGWDRSELRCDASVEVVWGDVSDEFSLPKFKIVK